jgi:hypothetical protein
MITLEYRAGQMAYTGSMRNGVSSNNYGSWRCSFAVVAPACAGGAMDCEGVCAAVATDPLHCGRCGNACGAMGSCAAGSCACAAGTTRCGASCVDTRTDAMHCGRCMNACPGGMACAGGSCGAPPATWSTNALDHDCAMPGVVGATFTYACPPGGTAGSVWGTDVYTNDSSVCTAGVHFGRINLATGGMVTIQMAPGQAMYMGSMRNGITSSDYGMWGCSYLFR